MISDQFNILDTRRYVDHHNLKWKRDIFFVCKNWVKSYYSIYHELSHLLCYDTCIHYLAYCTDYKEADNE